MHLKRVHLTKYFRVTIDQHLKWAMHIENVIISVNCISTVEIYKYKNKTISVDVKIIKVQRIQPVKM